jgi:CubicO group peptidase (beta-lactamase class C family)
MFRFKEMVLAGALYALTGPGISLAVETSEIDQVFREYNHSDSPGCSVAVYKDGRTVFSKGYGMASLELRVPNSPQTVFYVGSVSKQFVAASVVLAVRQGHLSLDDDIREFLPEIPDYGETITVRHLIHHTSGLRDYLGLMYLGHNHFENVYSDEWIIELIARQKALNFPPGERYLYSNSGYFLLAQIIERATGQTLREFAEANIFRPLGMRHTHFHDDRGHVFANRAMSYEEDDDGEYRLEWYTNFDKVGSGGLMTTVEDLLHWDGVFYGRKFGGEGFAEQMLETGKLNDGEELDYAFALSVGEFRGVPMIAHSGGFMGFRAQLMRFPEQHLSVAALCNLGSADPTTLSQEVAALFLAADLDPEEATVLAEADEIEADTVNVKEAERITGRYWSEEEQFAREIRIGEGTVLYVRSEEDVNALTPRADSGYRMLGVPVEAIVRFEPAGVSPAERMTVAVGDEEPTVLERFVPWMPNAEELGRLTGTFHNDELQADYILEVVEGQLVIGEGTDFEVVLEPVFENRFTTTEGGALTFSPAEGAGPKEFTLDAGRVRGLEFIRH